MLKIMNKYKYLLLLLFLIFTFQYLLNNNKVINNSDPHLIVIAFNSSYSDNHKIASLFNEVASIGEFVKNIYIEDVVEYRRSVLLKSLNEYNFNLWKNIYTSNSISSFINNISYIVERTYLSRYDDQQVPFVDLLCFLRRLNSFINIKNEILFGSFSDTDLLINSILFDDIISHFEVNKSYALIQLEDSKSINFNNFIINIKDVFERSEIEFDIYMPDDINKPIKLNYVSFSDLELYENYYNQLNKSNKVTKIYNFLNYYNSKQNHNRYQFINRIVQVNQTQEDLTTFINSLEVLEEKIMELQSRYGDNPEAYKLLHNLCSSENNENTGLLTSLIYNLKISEVDAVFNTLSLSFIKSLNELILDSRNMTQMDIDLVPDNIKSFFIKDNRYVIRYY